MAGDWIKMRTDLYRDPKLCIIADLLMGADGDLGRYVSRNMQRDMSVTRNVTRNAAVGALVTIWGVMRRTGKRVGMDLRVRGATSSVVDDIGELPGIGSAMQSVGWLVEDGEGIKFPNFFEEYNVDPAEDASAKAAERQRRHREKRRLEEGGARNVTVTLHSNAREEKRREEKSKEEIPPVVPQGGQPVSAHSKQAKPKRTDSYPDAFEQFWVTYPPIRKANKPGAFKAWQKATRDVPTETILAAAVEFADSTLGCSEFCPGPEPWLNQRRWEDDRRSWAGARNAAAAAKPVDMEEIPF